GTVGAEVFRLLTEHANDYTQRIGGPVEVRGIAVSDLKKDRPGVPAELITDDARALIARDDVDLVVEVIGGIDYPRELVLDARTAARSGVTANEALLGARAAGRAAAADAAGVELCAGAAVAAAAPRVRMLRRRLAGDDVGRIS